MKSLPLRTTHRPAARRRTTVALCYAAVGVALITVCSWLSVPVLTVPFTLQTFAIFFVLGLLGTRLGLLTVAAYLLLGIAGVPVFSGFGAGLARLLGPTGGYIGGFLLSCVVTGPLMRLARDNPVWQYLAMLAGLVVCYAMGTVWYAYVGGNLTWAGLLSALMVCVVPFVAVDAAKLLVAVLALRRLRPMAAKALERQGDAVGVNHAMEKTDEGDDGDGGAIAE